jgi:arylsulfatase
MVTRREFCAAPAFLRALSQSKPNLLLLMADQYRADCLGAEGCWPVHTPNLDSIAKRGVRFRHAYSTTPTCTPARSALLTGLAPWNHGMLGYGRVAEHYPVELPHALRDCGYQTLGIGKMHWAPQRNLHGFHQTILDESGRVEAPEFLSDYRAWFRSEAPNLDPDATGIGWNDYKAGVYKLPERLHPTRWTADVAVRFLESYQQAAPFFLKVSFARPHSPYDPPQRWMDHYKDTALPSPALGAWAAQYEPRNSNRDDIWHGKLDASQVRYSRQGYCGSVSFIDEQIGRVLEALGKRGWLDETLIVFLADHGDMTADHNLWRKSYAYEPSARIPMLLAGPGVPRGDVRDTPVEIRDILPTLLAAAGGTPATQLDGKPLLTVDRAWIDLEHDVCYNASNHWNALTDGKTKYIYHAQTGAEQLFDLTRDPDETMDLSADSQHETILRQWRSRLVEHLTPRGEEWVRGGKLVPRPKSQLYSPNYPKSSA